LKKKFQYLKEFIKIGTTAGSVSPGIPIYEVGRRGTEEGAILGDYPTRESLPPDHQRRMFRLQALIGTEIKDEARRNPYERLPDDYYLPEEDVEI
jgi:hypothetical protein